MKHIFTLLLTFFVSVQLPAQVQWMNPMNEEEPCISGRWWNQEIGKSYHRLPARFEATIPQNVWKLSRNDAGLIVRFSSTSKSIRVRFGVETAGAWMKNMAPMGHTGVDLYGKTAEGKTHWIGIHGMGTWKKDTITYEWKNLTVPNFKSRGIEYTLYLPGYNTLKFLEIGIDNGSEFHFIPQSLERPIVVYGSSIIQGASASRPGMMITNIVERELEYPIVNLGFSGSARMEPEMFDLLSEIDARAFILDPMPNSFNLKEDEIIKRATEGVRKLRAKSAAPILLVECHPTPDSVFRSNVNAKYNRGNAALRKAYDQLKSEGVANLFYLPKSEIRFTEDYMVEGSHPNDLGNRAYADAYEAKIREMLPEDKASKRYPPVTQRRDGCYEWRIRHNRVLELNRTTDPEILLIGNSITHFWGGEPAYGVNNGKSAWAKTFGKRRVTNMGSGWDRIENVYWRIFHGELEGCSPKHICLLIGINNYADKEADIAQGVADLAQLIRQRQPQAQLHVLKIYPARNREAKVARINKLLEQKLVVDDKTELVDLTSCLLLKDGSGKIDPTCFEKDGLHPNEKGYLELGKLLKKHLK